MIENGGGSIARTFRGERDVKSVDDVTLVGRTAKRRGSVVVAVVVVVVVAVVSSLCVLCFVPCVSSVLCVRVGEVIAAHVRVTHLRVAGFSRLLALSSTVRFFNRMAISERKREKERGEWVGEQLYLLLLLLFLFSFATW